ncbi:hypothetical protein RB195_019388 [Necator americanus]|uniref:Galactosylgalactosylxylosylprotein 3-beta-glucuronosyltransferase n=1 Tax=Necator americanus TaxID=51031 RepID=A0ABR1CDW6_NECAM
MASKSRVFEYEDANGATMEGVLYLPLKAHGPRELPAVLVLHAFGGCGDFECGRAETLANVGAIGYCFGGLCALDLARYNVGLKAAVSFHGTLSPLPDTELTTTSTSMQVHHGDGDIHIKMPISEFMEEMRSRKADWMFTSYGKAEHGFTEPRIGELGHPGVSYNKEADTRSWQAAVAFLNERLQQQSACVVEGKGWAGMKDISPRVELVSVRSPHREYQFSIVLGEIYRVINGRGWTHRNLALQYVRENYDRNFDAVLYFADDDNSYDVRLFNNYIRNVSRIGVWAVGLVGGAWVEAPHVSAKGKVIAWDVMFAPNRPFATDMAGFAINTKELFRARNATFNAHCAKNYKQGPESCFLSQFGFTKQHLEPFGYKEYPKEILVWHTKTSKSKTRGPKRGYAIE